MSETIKMPVVMALVAWRKLREVGAKNEADLIASNLIGQGIEIDGSADETFDFYSEYLITHGLLSVETAKEDYKNTWRIIHGKEKVMNEKIKECFVE